MYPKRSTTSRENQSQNDAKFSTRVFTNTSANDISSQCQNLCINSDSDEIEENSVYPKKKNAKKKDKLKQLKIPQGYADSQIAHTSQAYSGLQRQQNDGSYVPEFFMTQIRPLYASTNSKYLENMSHHPQFQYMYMQQGREFYPNTQHVVSVPNTPLVQQYPVPKSMSIPCSPVIQTEQNSVRFLQNMMQHPLLNKSFSLKPGESFGLTNGVQNISNSSSNMSPKKGKSKKKSEKYNTDNTFEPYLSVEEVEKGLKSNTLIQGVVRINPKQFQHAYVSSSDRSEQDYFIDGMQNRNRALEGDVVVLQLIDNENEDNNEPNKQRKGKVVFIKEKVHNRTCIGSLKLMQDKNRQMALFVPRDHRIPRLNIAFNSWPDNFYLNSKAYKNTLFSAKIIDWSDTRFAIGTIICNIGQSGDMMAETKAILAQTDIDITPYGPEVRHLYPRLDYTIPIEELKQREDCRKLCIFSIDPFNCRDIDDAMSCIELENGNYEIGVHISDVAHFLTENTQLDEKVAEKATTIYLVEKAYHMLPDELCLLCSLCPGVDKLAFSVFWEINKDAQILRHRFSKTVIHSCAQLAYDHAQAILDDDKEAESKFPETYNGFSYENVYNSIKILGRISATFRKNRFESGALRIDQPKVAFNLNASNGLPESFCIYESKESHQLIEEFMLLTNMTVATRIHEDHPKLAFLRCHPPPSAHMLTELSKSLKPMGIVLEISSAGDLYHSLLPHVGPDNTDRGKAMVLNMLCAKPMTRAKYFCAGGGEEDFHHYALNVPLYTHFTSPIRRYADVMVHRLLAASLDNRDQLKWEVDKVCMIAAQCNKQKYNAKKASELSTELYTIKYIELHSPLVTEAVVVEVREKYLDVIIVAMGLNRRIFLNNDFPGEFNCIKHEGSAKLSKMELTWHATKHLPEIKQVVEVFTIIKVKLQKEDDMVKVETKLARP